MEHSLLHALQLCGIVVALGGAFFVLALLLPVSRRLSLPEAERIKWESVTARWIFCGAITAAIAAGTDLCVQVAEVQGKSIYGGVDPAEVFRFSAETAVGRFGVLRALTLLALGLCALGNVPRKWWFVALFGGTATLLSALVSHSAAVPVNWAAAVLAQVMHIAVGALWIGTLANLLACRALFLKSDSDETGRLMRGIVARFSPVAIGAVIAIGFSGVYSLYRFVQSPAAIITSAYGLVLMLKLLLIAVVVGTGFLNWRVVRPALNRVYQKGGGETAKDGGVVLRRFSRMLELEVTAGILVITVAGIMGSIAPPGANGLYRLGQAEVKALLTPDLPTISVPRPADFVGADERTRDDLLYAEFTHNWSGVFVILLGLCWLGQSITNQTLFSRAWPLLLVPFAIFISVAADPEVWLLHKMSLREVLSTPEILEHQIGALLVVAMVWLGWRDGKSPMVRRPLGYALPIIMTLGSLMLLGHAHSTFTTSAQLGTVINVQHVVIGAFGLFAGATRWLQLRGLLPQRAARILWPGSVVCLGLVMAFFYRELI
jgi:putative copper resistance protein D